MLRREVKRAEYFAKALAGLEAEEEPCSLETGTEEREGL